MLYTSNPFTHLLDTEAEVNRVRKEFSKKDGLMNIKKQQLLPLRVASKESISLDGTILLFVPLGDVSVRIWFGVLENFRSWRFTWNYIHRHVHIYGILSERKKCCTMAVHDSAFQLTLWSPICYNLDGHYLVPIHQRSMLHQRIRSIKIHAFQVLVSSLSSKSRWVSKLMVLSHRTAPPCSRLVYTA